MNPHLGITAGCTAAALTEGDPPCRRSAVMCHIPGPSPRVTTLGYYASSPKPHAFLLDIFSPSQFAVGDNIEAGDVADVVFVSDVGPSKSALVE